MRVAVIGLGKLGLPMAAVFSGAGHDVIGADLNVHTVERINSGLLPLVAPRNPGGYTDQAWELARTAGSPIDEPGLAPLMRNHPFKATTSVEDAAEQSEVVFVVVPTPSLDDDRFDPSRVADACRAAAEGFARRSGRGTIVVASTLMPGDTEAVIAPAIESSGLVVGDTVGLVYSPEFIALGSVVYDLRCPCQVILGSSDQAASDACAAVYRQVYREARTAPPMSFLSIREAEMAKIAVNAYLCTKITFANMLGAMCATHGIDARTVADVVGRDSRIGGHLFKPAAPLGGPCLPRDARAFATLGEPNLMGAVTALDEALHDWLLRTVTEQVPSEAKATVGTVGILGMAYKPGTPVTDDSPGWRLALALMAKGRRVIVHDPLAFSPMGAATAERVEDAVWPSMVVIATPHPEYKKLRPCAGQTFIDLWGITQPGDGRTLAPWQTLS